MKSTITRAAVLAALYGVGGTAVATPASGGEESGLGEIVVTAQRREERLQTTPVAVTALTPEALEKFQIENSEDVAKTVPNLKFMPLTGSRSTLQVSLRGGSEQSGGLVTSESSVAFYVDDVYRGRLAGSNLELADVERIEVLRGPQGTLYGRNAFSGAVKVVTRTPEDQSWFDAAAGFGAFSEKRASASIGGPLVEGSLGGSLSMLFRDRDGLFHNIPLNRDVWAERNVAVRGKLHFFGSDALKATLTLSVTRDDNDASANYVPITSTVPIPPSGPANPGQFVTTDVVVPLAGRYNSLSPYPPDGGTDQDAASLDLSGPLGGLTWRSITSYVRTKDFFAFDLSGGRVTPQGQYWIASLARRSDADTKQYSQELQLASGPESTTFKWIVGLYWFQEDSTQVLVDKLGLAPTFLLDVLPQTIDAKTRSYAAFTQGTYSLTERLSLTAGLRYTKDEKRLNGSIQNRLPFGPGPAIGLVPVNLSPSFESWTPKLGLDFKVTDDVFTYVSASKGFKAGGFNGLAVANPTVFSTVYQPQNVWAYEAGLKATLFDSKLLANVAVFRNELKALQQTIQIALGSFATQNVGDAKVDGLELELSTAPIAVPTGGVTFFLNGGLMNDEYRKLSPLSDAAVNGAKRLPILSRWNYRAGFNYESAPVLAGWRLRAGADWTEVGPYFSVVNNRLRTEGFGLLDANVGLVSENDRWALTVSGKNLTNTYYFTTAGSPDAIAVGERRTWFVGARYRM